MKLRIICVGILLVFVLSICVFAKPERIVNDQVKNDKDAISVLGDYVALTNSIYAAFKDADQRAILLKIVGSAYQTQAGKDKTKAK